MHLYQGTTSQFIGSDCVTVAYGAKSPLYADSFDTLLALNPLFAGNQSNKLAEFLDRHGPARVLPSSHRQVDPPDS
jgi:hypothetical protein